MGMICTEAFEARQTKDLALSQTESIIVYDLELVVGENGQLIWFEDYL